MDLRGSHVVIVGGSSGIGLATAQMASRAGARVTIAARGAEKLEQARATVGRVDTVVADVTAEGDVRHLFEKLDSVDHVVVAAGRPVPGGVVDADLETLRVDVDQRLWGAIHVTRHAVPRMDGGSITFLSGQFASRPVAGAVVTAATNAAVEALARGLAVEVAPIRVNAVAPGIVDTALLGSGRDAAASYAARLPVARMGRPEEVAAAILLLMANDFITGEVLHVDGGGRYV